MAALIEYAAGEGAVPDGPGELLDPYRSLDPDAAGRDVAREAGSAGGATREDERVAGPDEAAGPDRRRVEDSYDEFLRRYQQESGQDSGPS